jgi:hypothetical protein
MQTIDSRKYFKYVKNNLFPLIIMMQSAISVNINIVSADQYTFLSWCNCQWLITICSLCKLAGMQLLPRYIFTNL